MAITSKSAVQSRNLTPPGTSTSVNSVETLDAKKELRDLKAAFDAKAKILRIAIHQAKIKELSL